MARRGGEADIKSKPITIREFEITRLALPDVDFRVTCSKGTYIRSLARDFGAALGCGAHLTQLVRTRIGEYHLSDSLSLADIEAQRPPRPAGDVERPPRPRRERQPERRAGLQHFAAGQAAPPQSEKPATD